VTDPLERVARFDYDSLGRLTGTEDPLGAVTDFGYDPNGNLTSVKDAEGNSTDYAYDELDRLESIEDALGNSESYDYDETSNLSVFTDALGNATYYSHDLAGRRTRVAYPTNGENEFGYDAAGNMVRATDARGTTYFGYDRMNRLTSETAPDAAETSHAYDQNSNRTRVTSPAGSAYYTFDKVDRMTEAKSSDATVGAAGYAYDGAGNLIRKSLGNGCFTYFAYDDNNRITSIKNCLPGGGALAYFNYSHDAAGRITTVVREDDTVVYYGYDDADRLASERWQNSGGAELYAFEWNYDLVGNRTYQKRGNTESYYTYNAANELTQVHELPSTGTYFAYDSRGNCLRIQESAGTSYFRYNDVNLVTVIKYPNAQENKFYYDALLRRYAMEDSSGLSYFTWDSNGMNLLCERDAAGSVIAYYTHGYAPVNGIGSGVGQKLVQGGTTYHEWDAGRDHRGSVYKRVDANGNISGNFNYDAWGVPLQEDETGAETRFRYQPNWIKLKDDPEGDTYLSPTRPYKAGLGRFLGRDAEAVLAGGYFYCYDQPTVLADNDGRDPKATTKGRGGTTPKPAPIPTPKPVPTPERPIWPSKPDKLSPEFESWVDPLTLGKPPGMWRREKVKGPLLLADEAISFAIIMRHVLPKPAPKGARQVWQVVECLQFYATSPDCIEFGKMRYTRDILDIDGQESKLDLWGWSVQGKNCVGFEACTATIGFSDGKSKYPGKLVNDKITRAEATTLLARMRAPKATYRSRYYFSTRKGECAKCCPTVPVVTGMANFGLVTIPIIQRLPISEALSCLFPEQTFPKEGESLWIEGVGKWTTGK